MGFMFKLVPIASQVLSGDEDAGHTVNLCHRWGILSLGNSQCYREVASKPVQCVLGRKNDKDNLLSALEGDIKHLCKRNKDVSASFSEDVQKWERHEEWLPNTDLVRRDFLNVWLFVMQQ